MKIVLDAMGSENMPAADVAGAIEAARLYPDDEIVLVGRQPLIEAELAKHNTAGLNLTVVHAEELIEMTDKPRAIVRGKPNSSMHVGLNLVKDGTADAFVSMGNTGCTLAVSMLATLKRIPGVKRPAIGAIFPLPSRPILLDNGANADCQPEHLYQFGIMGSIYASCVTGNANPTIGLVSNGEEEGKGNELVKEASILLSQSTLNFVGNIEPKDFMSGKIDVAIADGFVGNIMLKTAEATAKTLTNLIRTEIQAGVLTTLGGLLARPALKRVGTMLDPDEVGGAPLLGVNGVVIIGHGSSGSKAICNAIGQARKAVESGVVEAIRKGIKSS
ncbi:MAG: glycerol-3-phosphate acyltransferase PlsX [Cellvibrionaceae bacterium]|jgi:glycerol-3-phosphate acyltransferase PlsX